MPQSPSPSRHLREISFSDFQKLIRTGTVVEAAVPTDSGVGTIASSPAPRLPRLAKGEARNDVLYISAGRESLAPPGPAANFSS